MRAAIYARISDDREGREIGVDDQVQQCDAEAARAGLNVVDTYKDNDLSASSKTAKRRPDYERLLADARARRFDVIVALSTSRLTRRPREHEDLIDLATGSGIRYRFVKSPSFDMNSADGRMVARTLAAADAAEAERTAERVRDNVRGRAERGEFHGGPLPFGYEQDKDGRLVVVEAEAAEIRQWYPLVLAGGTLYGIRSGLERRGVPTASGKPWCTPVIRKILLSPRNAGLREYGGVERPGPHPAIVDEQVWRAVRSLLIGRTGFNTARKHLGTGLYVCERCQRTISSSHDRRWGNRSYRCLTCSRTWQAERIDRWISDLVAGVLGREDARERLLPKPREGGADFPALAAERTAIVANMAELGRAFVGAKGATLAAVRAGLEEGERRLAEIDATTAAASRVDAVAAILVSEDPVAAWRGLDAADVGRRQAVIRGLMAITLGAPIRGRATWDAQKFIFIEPR